MTQPTTVPETNGKHAAAASTPVAKVLATECLPSRTPDMDYWWRVTGSNLAHLVHEAGYPIERQFQTLLFHYHNVVPFMGPGPDASGNPKYQSLFGADGSPIEWSWKWNAADKPASHPEIRCAFEAIGELSGTALDPLNQHRGREFMQHMAATVPSAHFGWPSHFLAHLFDHDLAKYKRENDDEGGRVGGTLGFAVEYGPKGVGIKTYLGARKLGHSGRPGLQEWTKAIYALDHVNANCDAVLSFLKKNSEGKLLKPFMLAPDNVDPSRARLKLYFMSPHTSFASVREVLTLGGKLPVPEKALSELRSVVNAVLGLPPTFPEDQPVPSKTWTPEAKDIFANQHALTEGWHYFFDVAPGAQASISDVKLYIPLRQYGPPDEEVAHATAEWMRAHGRGSHADGFLRAVESFALFRGGLGGAKGVCTYLGCIIRTNGELEVTSYISPQAYHPARFQTGGKRGQGRIGFSEL